MEYNRNCPNCNKLLTYSNIFHLSRAIRINSICQTCNCTIRNKTRDYSKGQNNSQWKSSNEIPYSWFSKYFERKKKNNKRKGNITIEQIYDMWIKQDKKCNLSNVIIGFNDDNKGHTCSIDRIDSSKEYTLDNIQLVHKDINRMKNAFNQDYFIDMCKKVAQTKM